MLEEAARRGLLGGRVADHRAHSSAFVAVVRALLDAPEPFGGSVSRAGEEDRSWPPAHPELADIGSGAGVPGLVLAEELPGVAVTLIERREGRAAWLEEAAGALSADRIGIHVWCADVYDLAHGAARGRFDLVTARAFGSPAVTAELGGALVRPGGVLVVSEPPDEPHRWDEVDLAGLGLVDGGPVAGDPVAGDPVAERTARFRLLVRRAPLASHRPRRKPRPS